MTGTIRNQEEILAKLGIEQLNPMQEATLAAVEAGAEVVLLSPTGTGKTLAFLLPVLATLDPAVQEVQALVLVPSRELAIQIAQVTRDTGVGVKSNAVYGGRAISKDKLELKTRPAILIGTPGRIADHLRRGTFSPETVQTLVLDEFDKSLEVGFESEMKEIISSLPNLSKKVLTSATQGVAIPKFVGLRNPEVLDFLEEKNDLLQIKTILSPVKDKLEVLVKTLCQLGDQPGIVFFNFKDTIEFVSDYLTANGIPHGRFYGGMEQIDRERVLIKFRNGTYRLILATDLAARGLDIPEITFILHYQLPNKEHEFTHRNGRTARMKREGAAYILQWKGEELPDYIGKHEVMEPESAPLPSPTPWQTLFISGGRRDKISKGDIAGFFLKQGNLQKEQLGNIEIKEDCAFVAVLDSEVKRLLPLVDQARLKTKKVRVHVV